MPRNWIHTRVKTAQASGEIRLPGPPEVIIVERS
jgi:hypothetical protein